MPTCQYARCEEEAVWGFPDDSTGMYCEQHKSEGMERKDAGAAEDQAAPAFESGRPGGDYYDILGVSKDVSSAQIKRAYHKLALQYHPDKHVGDDEAERNVAEAKFREISEAYSVLGDEKKRKAYDLGGKDVVKENDEANAEDILPEGFTVLHAKEMYRNTFGDPEDGADMHFYEFEFLRQNSQTGMEERGKAPVRVITQRKGNTTITTTTMVYGQPPKRFSRVETQTVQEDGSVKTETTETVKKISCMETCCLQMALCGYLLTCGFLCNCCCNCCFNCCCNGCCGILPACVDYLNHAKATHGKGEAPTPENMDR